MNEIRGSQAVLGLEWLKTHTRELVAAERANNRPAVKSTASILQGTLHDFKAQSVSMIEPRLRGAFWCTLVFRFQLRTYF